MSTATTIVGDVPARLSTLGVIPIRIEPLHSLNLIIECPNAEQANAQIGERFRHSHCSRVWRRVSRPGVLRGCEGSKACTRQNLAVGRVVAARRSMRSRRSSDTARASRMASIPCSHSVNVYGSTGARVLLRVVLAERPISLASDQHLSAPEGQERCPRSEASAW